MPFNGSNTFTIVNVFVPGTTILSSAVNTNFSDIATGLSDCVTRDAQGAVTGNLLFSSTGYMGLPTGTTNQRPNSATQGWFRFNSTLVIPEYFDGTSWDSLGPTIVKPQGYLTLTNLASGGPITTSDQTAATSVFYPPYEGQLCPIYNGTSFANQVFSEQTLTLVSAHTASNLFDVFAFLNSGVFTIGTGPAWSTSTAGSCSRGTGAGTTQLQRLNGLNTNAQSITVRNGVNTYTVAANQGTYLGTIFIDSTPGQVSCYVTYGQNRKWGVWNAYNKNHLYLKAGDSTANWSYNSATPRQSNAATGNNLIIFSGLAEDIYELGFRQNVTPGVGGNSGNVIGIGINSTSSITGFEGEFTNTASETALVTISAQYFKPPALGINQINSLEASSGTSTFFGTETNMVLSALWRG